MQFTKSGPDVPERLLQAHEGGRVVFFCGAGISYPAALPGFKGLVDKLYEARNVVPNAVQAAAIKNGRYDTAVGLLETQDVGGRESVRLELANILNPDLKAPRATDTHKALLTLGTTRDGRTRLVTTNFDRIFEAILNHSGSSVARFRAPLLPIPKSHWDGLVYLHGLLTENPSRYDLTRLVISSGDFGLAYLTERWAARFVSDLLRNYTVCFVGYSLDDPVLRYMTDALSADRLMGESTREMFAFGVYSRGKETEEKQAWEAKGVTPILYKAHWRHAYLHRTLRHWSETYRDGARGKERIAVEYALANPRASLKHDDFVSRMLWALTDPGGLPAKRFAELDPVPSLDWLEPLSDTRFGYQDLQRFGVQPNSDVDDKLAFSLTHRPSPYHLAPWMTLADAGGHAGHWDDVMRHLAHWLTRHLDDPVLLLHLAKLGGRVHERLRRQIEHRMRRLTSLESDGSTAELARIRASAPRAIPSAPMRTLWHLLLMGRIRSGTPNRDLYGWKDRFHSDGLTPSVRLELREMLTPRVMVSGALPRLPVDSSTEQPERVSDLVDWKIVLSTDMIQPRLGDLPDDDRWKAVLPELLSEFSGLLRDALDLMRELGGANDKTDLSYVHQPSIGPHPQNRAFHDWTALIEFTRAAWLATSISSPHRAERVAEDWWQTPYPVFRRLAMFAATQNEIVSPRRGLDWLIEDGGWWLWSVETKRESIRLLVHLATNLDDTAFRVLERTILAGPPRRMFRENLEPRIFTRIVDDEVWFRLAKVAHEGRQLGTKAVRRLASLGALHPEWQLADDERDEFSSWISDSSEARQSITTPADVVELAVWLKDNPGTDPWHEDDWSDRCRNDFDSAASALALLAGQNVWPTGRWGRALYVWSDEELMQRAWDRIAPILAKAPPKQLLTLSHDLGLWLCKIAGKFDGQKDVFFCLCDNVLALAYEDLNDATDPVSSAINHPVGKVTEALLAYWYRQSLEDGQELPSELKCRFSRLFDRKNESFRHGRVLLAAHVVHLFRVDPEWTGRFLLPLFDWSHSEPEARAAWEGFLWSPQLYRPLVEEFRREFLDTASHYEQLGQFKGQYATLLAFGSLDPSDVFTNVESAKAIRALPQDGLETAADALVRAMEGAGNQRVPYWTNRMKPYLRSVWPSTRDKSSAEISESLARVCVAAQDAFREALAVVRPWLRPVSNDYRLVHSLLESDLCRKFPREALELLDRVIDIEDSWPSDELAECLRAIHSTEPTLGNDPRFVRLREYLEQRGQDL